MAQFQAYEGAVWSVLSVLSLVSLLLFAAVLLHFRSLLRSVDICVAGLLIRNFFYCVVVAPVGISHAFSPSAAWSIATCRLLVFFLHSSLMVSLIGAAFFAVDRMFLLRKDGGPIYNGWVTNKVKPLLLISIWCCAAFITGLVPVNLWTQISSSSSSSSSSTTHCHFLPSQLDYSYSMVLSACNAGSSLICLICSLDGLLFLRECSQQSQEEAASNAGSATSGSHDGGVAGNGLSNGSVVDNSSSSKEALARTNAHDFSCARRHAWESWRVTSLVNLLIFLFNHLPMLILDFSALVSAPNRTGSEYLWLILIESLCIPNSLWLAAVRYRHVVLRYSRMLLRKSSPVDDAYCATQMFQKRCTLMGSVYRGQQHRRRYGNGLSSTNSNALNRLQRQQQRQRQQQQREQQQQQQQGEDEEVHETISHVTAQPITAAAAAADNSPHQLQDPRRPSRLSGDASLRYNIGLVRSGSRSTTSNNNADATSDLASPISVGEVVRAAVLHQEGGVSPGAAATPPAVASLETLPEDPWRAGGAGAAAADAAAFPDDFYIDAEIVEEGEGEEEEEEEEVAEAMRHIEQGLRQHEEEQDDDEEEESESGEAFYLSDNELRRIAERNQQQQQQQQQPDTAAAAAAAAAPPSVLKIIDTRRPRSDPLAETDSQFAFESSPFPSGFDDFSSFFTSEEEFDATKQSAAAAAAAAAAVSSEGSDVEQGDQGNNFSQELDVYL